MSLGHETENILLITCTMMDYFYKLVLKTLLLIGGVERNPGPKQGPPPLGIKKNPEQSRQLEEPNVLRILQQIQGRLAQIQENFQKSIKEQTNNKLTVQQLQEGQTTTKQSLQQLQQSQEELKLTVQQLLEGQTTTQQSLQRLQQSPEQGLHTSHNVLQRNKTQISGLKELVAQYRGYEDDDSWRRIVELLERSLDPSCVVYQQLEDMKNYPFPLFVSDKGHLELLELLLEHGLDVNKMVDCFNSTLLHRAVFNCHVPVVRLLLQRGADINKTDNWGNTPLHCSSSKGHLRVCQVLVEAGCDPGVKNNDNHTALDIASRTDVLQYLSSLRD
uniref:Uncharacterized protein n=1 Tax=Timema cristinae TaxID=61476 RepID=A0A7R9D9L7_TIMCR|nr:unnamed protein product [Timema cristinae]